MFFLLQISQIAVEDFEELRAEQENGDHVGNDDEANGHISDIVSPHCQATVPYFR